jgi:subtilisin family serine protease
VNEYTVALNGFSAILTADEAAAVERQPGVAFVAKDVFRKKTTDASPTFLGLNAPGGPWLKGYTGEGVVVGVIDSGIWPEHPSFADDGSYPSLGITLDETDRSACDFGNTAANPNDAPFTCNDKLLGARQMLDTYRALTGQEDDEFDSARDDDGHGSHTAATAAGNAGVKASIAGVPRGTISGIAPRARVIAYKGLGNLGGYGSDLAAAIDQAVYDGVDVINYSVGGGASLTGADDIAYLFAADAGVFVATPATPGREPARSAGRARCRGSPRWAPARSRASSRRRPCWATGPPTRGRRSRRARAPLDSSTRRPRVTSCATATSPIRWSAARSCCASGASTPAWTRATGSSSPAGSA